MTATVTGLRERQRGRVAVELDGIPWRVLPAGAVVRARLAVGKTLERETARELARELRRERALAHATRSLAASARSRRALEEQLARRGHSAAARQDALAVLAHAGLLDDDRFARNRAEALARRGYGDAAIHADLHRRLVAPEAAADAVASLESEADRARRLLEAQAEGGDADRATLLRRLAARGFSHETLDDISAAFAHGT